VNAPVKAVVTAASLILVAAGSLAQERACKVDAFRGASEPTGATTNMRVTNTGTACRIINMGVPTERRNPAVSGSITKPPTHGSAEFAAPFAKYTPHPGYAGEDEFEYEASVTDIRDQPGRLKVKVKVNVIAP
jgi:hypothetical protein